jgi:hypothetical protein
MVVSPTGPGTKNNCTDYDSRKFFDPTDPSDKWQFVF